MPSEASTREKILLEAEKRFISDGIEKTQMQDIAASLKINRRTLYRYFPTKDELAFEIELVVMGKIQQYLGSLIDGSEYGSGFEKVRAYFGKVDLDRLYDLMKFTAEFDRYFRNDYPNRETARSFVEALDPGNDPLYRFIAEGMADGSIRGDMPANQLFHFISHSFFALFQRLILRENHLKEEYCGDVDFKDAFKKVVLDGIRKHRSQPFGQ